MCPEEESELFLHFIFIYLFYYYKDFGIHKAL